MISFKKEKIFDFLKRNLDVKLSVGPKQKLLYGLQHFLCISHKDPEEQAIYTNILSHAILSEKSCPGAGILFLKLLVNEQVSHELNTHSSFKRKDVESLLRSKNYRKIITEILLTVLNISDRNTKISFRKCNNESYRVELKDGYSFDLKRLLKSDMPRLDKVKVICVDGYIENVSEVHRIFDQLSQGNFPCCLFVRGMSDDVLHTIKVNLDRGTLAVFPFIVPFDVESANTLVDIAIVSGTDPVSSLKGQVISTLDLDIAGEVETISSSGDVISMINGKTKFQVSQQIKRLKELVEERPEISTILSKRISQLSSKTLEVYIPSGMNFNYDSQQLDEGIRMISSIMMNCYNPLQTAQFYVDSYKRTSNETVILFTAG